MKPDETEQPIITYHHHHNYYYHHHYQYYYYYTITEDTFLIGWLCFCLILFSLIFVLLICLLGAVFGCNRVIAAGKHCNKGIQYN
jgi:hypothetical protein